MHDCACHASSLTPSGMAGCIATPWLLSPLLQQRAEPTAPSQLPTQTLAPNISHDDTGEGSSISGGDGSLSTSNSQQQAVQLLRLSNVTVVVAVAESRPVRWSKFAAAGHCSDWSSVRWPCSCHCSAAQHSEAWPHKCTDERRREEHTDGTIAHPPHHDAVSRPARSAAPPSPLSV